MSTSRTAAATKTAQGKKKAEDTTSTSMITSTMQAKKRHRSAPGARNDTKEIEVGGGPVFAKDSEGQPPYAYKFFVLNCYSVKKDINSEIELHASSALEKMRFNAENSS
jgi:hypothetical protein